MTEEQKLKAENIRLKVIINQLQVTLADRNFQLERIKLMNEQEKFVNDNELSEFNWNTLTESVTKE